ncbi:IBR domain, a half RING-finger domain-containing protein [Ditylenchus destructor]|nr:IBR domain, a half RING-finger domain-containing protein [Ditylenchus destructor]
MVIFLIRYLSSLFESSQPKMVEESHKHKEVMEMFPNLNLDQLLKEYDHVSNETLVEIILTNMPKVQKKPKKFNVCRPFGFLIKLLSKLLPCESLRTRIATIFDDQHSPDLPDFREKMECLICYEVLLVQDMVFCDCTVRPAGAATSLSTHSFCRQCLENHAKAAVEEMPLAKGGIGLKCMMCNCDNPIIFPEIQCFISSDLTKRLEDRSTEESIALAGLKYLERCRKCNCGVEMEQPPEKIRSFKCPDCKYEFCRSCELPWEDHQGISCAEMESRSKNQKAEHILQKQLSEAVVRKCPKCSLAFVKDGGCNFMRCRCGTTQCYICRNNGISYSHFCSHTKMSYTGSFKCSDCDSTCLLWEDPNVRDKIVLKKIQRSAKSDTSVNVKYF